MDYKINIYKITNSLNNKIYVGSTKKTLEKRMKWHIRASKIKNFSLYREMRAIGSDKFSIELLEERDCYCREIQLQDEREWFDILQPELNERSPFQSEDEKMEAKRMYNNTDKRKDYMKVYQKDYGKTNERKKYKKEYMRRYRKEIKEAKRFYCEKCDSSFTSESHLKKHFDALSHRGYI